MILRRKETNTSNLVTLDSLIDSVIISRGRMTSFTTDNDVHVKTHELLGILSRLKLRYKIPS